MEKNTLKFTDLGPVGSRWVEEEILLFDEIKCPGSLLQIRLKGEKTETVPDIFKLKDILQRARKNENIELTREMECSYYKLLKKIYPNMIMNNPLEQPPTEIKTEVKK